ncbi:MAG: proline dehydrogenase family protein [Mucilaginibacter polytrichastri]|nr:proline dehydrogenase family protein [Mucilaginibacter polytrichastri]
MQTDTPSPSVPRSAKLSFENTEIAFKHESDRELKRAYWLFKAISNPALVRVGTPLTSFAMRIGLPVKPVIKATIFNHFCGGETIEKCEHTIRNLKSGKVGSILDYSVEGAESEKNFDRTAAEIMRTIERATQDNAVPFSVFKITGVARFALLEKVQRKEPLSKEEKDEYQRVIGRVDAICQVASVAAIPLMIDAEESWIQNTIDDLAMDMMRVYNTKKAIVYNTYQLYRHDILPLFRHHADDAQKEGFMLGAKLVRGAYMEKERKRAEERGYESPIQSHKVATDRDYNDALRYALTHIEHVAIVAGTHNEQSCMLLAELMDEFRIPHNHPHVFFSQLLGMSDNLSFNLASAGYNVAKYVPYGPVKAVLPYLIRRANENTSIAGQMSRELALIVKEMKRRGI